MCTLFLLSFRVNSCKKSAEDPLKNVDTFIGTEGDKGQLYSGASYPFGLVRLSPETEGDSHVGYYYEDKYIEGFPHLLISGAGSQGKGGENQMGSNERPLIMSQVAYL